MKKIVEMNQKESDNMAKTIKTTKTTKKGGTMEDKKKSLLQALKFTLFSVSAGIIQVGSFALLELFIQTYWVAYLISLTCLKIRSLIEHFGRAIKKSNSLN
jgi:hypothetical protein